MQIEINSSIGQVGPVFNMTNLSAQLPPAYALVQDKPLVPETAYNTASGAAYPNQYISLPNTSFTFTPAGQSAMVNISIKPKSIVGGFDMDYGRVTAFFGVEVPGVPGQNLPLGIGYFNNDPETEIFNNTMPGTLIGSMADGTQIWKVTHNDVDKHILHVHMYNLQVINRVWWDGTIVPPEPNEYGWKESVEINPLQDLVVAMRPVIPVVPWELPNSIRPLNAVTAIGSSAPGEFTGLAPDGSQVNVVNHVVNMGYEYLWHCHVLGHEENDMMRTQSVAVAPAVPPSNVTAAFTGSSVNMTWKDNSVAETDFSIQRALSATGPWVDVAQIPSTTGPQKGGIVSFSDSTVSPNTTYFYRVMATNIVGDRTVYVNSIGYPTVSANSTPSSVVSTTSSTTSSSGISLMPGWNFVSTPKRLSVGNNTGLIFANVNTVAHSIWRYNATSQLWESVTPATTISPLDGFWVYSGSQTSVPLNFDTNPLQTPPTKALASGWNGVGFGDVNPATAHDTLSSVGGLWSIAIGYDANGQMFEISIINGGTGTHSDLRQMLPTKAYWLFMNQPGTLAALGA